MRCGSSRLRTSRMYESQLLGPNAFWWNSPPIKDGTALTRLLSVMGLNYERGVDQAFHSFGHRSESAMIQAYQESHRQGRGIPTSPTPSPWDLFTRINKDMPGQAHVGNIHFPPNGTSDYNYGNHDTGDVLRRELVPVSDPFQYEPAGQCFHVVLHAG